MTCRKTPTPRKTCQSDTQDTSRPASRLWSSSNFQPRKRRTPKYQQHFCICRRCKLCKCLPTVRCSLCCRHNQIKRGMQHS
jgi:hypothetical protein